MIDSRKANLQDFKPNTIISISKSLTSVKDSDDTIKIDIENCSAGIFFISQFISLCNKPDFCLQQSIQNN
jgi:hypothetical protein